MGGVGKRKRKTLKMLSKGLTPKDVDQLKVPLPLLTFALICVCSEAKPSFWDSESNDPKYTAISSSIYL